MRLQSLRRATALAAFALAASACAESVLEPHAKAGDARAQICADCEEGGGGGGGGGGTTIPPFDPPPSPVSGVSVPLDYNFNTGQPADCLQNPHAWVAFNLDVVQGTTLYPTGVVVPHSRANFYFYNSAGQLVKTHLTQPAHDNCVIYHEPEAMSTWDMPPGYYYIYASFWTLPYYNSGVWTGYPVGLTYGYIAVMRIR
jgi:hypothetical protein